MGIRALLADLMPPMSRRNAEISRRIPTCTCRFKTLGITAVWGFMKKTIGEPVVFFYFYANFKHKRTEKDMEETYAGIVEAILDFFFFSTKGSC